MAWTVLAASALLLPLFISQLPLPHPAAQPLEPHTLANAAYSLGIFLAAASLMLRRRAARPTGAMPPAYNFQVMLASAVLAEAIAWLGFAAWLADASTPAFHTMLLISAVVFWLIRPAQPAGAGTAHD